MILYNLKEQLNYFTVNKITSETVLSIAAGLNTLLILNYLFWIVGYGPDGGKIIFFGLFLFLIISLSYIILRDFRVWPLVIFLLFLAFLYLGTPSGAWDARSIWLFHAKRIFIESNIFAQFDGYAGWSHNHYPVIVPALSASMASAVGAWNEIFPKSAGWFFIASPLLVLVAVLRNSALFCLFFVGLLFLCGDNLFNGYMDSLVALYSLSAIMTLPTYSLLGSNQKLNFKLYYLSATSLIILSLIKNEGFLLVKIFFLAILISNIILFKKINIKMLALIFIGPFLFGISWEKLANLNGIFDIMLNPTSILNNFLQRYDVLDNYIKIFTSLNGGLYLTIVILACIFLIKNFRNGSRKIIFTPMIIFILYFFAIFIVYLITPYDLVWHLSTSVDRLKITLNVLAYGIFLEILYSSLLLNDDRLLE